LPPPVPTVPSVSYIVGLILETCGDFPAIDPEQRMKMIGRHLVEFGSAAIEEFENIIRQLIRIEGAQLIIACAKALNDCGGSPPAWANEVEQWMSALKASYLQKNSPMPLEFKNGRSPSDALKSMQKIVFQYGRLLQWWPAMISEIQRLRTRVSSPGDRTPRLSQNRT
jgi:hypothetical protein